MLVVKDFAANFLAAPISANATVLAVVDASGLPDLSAPGSFCWLVLQSATDRSKVEIVRAVGQSGNTYTIQRGWNTTPLAFAAGDYVEQRITVSTFAYYTEQLVSGLAEAGSGNLLRDGGPVLTALIQALSNAVTLDGAETITGAKTFTGETLYPATPVAGTEISNKNYVDNAIRSALAAIDWASIVTTNTVQDITAAKVFKANLSVSGAMANFASATAVNVPTPTVRPNAVNKGYFDDWFDANAEASSGLLMRVNGPRDQQIANALANTTGGAYVSASAPPSPFQGMRWFDITVGRTFIYYIDASNHGQWVEENPQSPDWITTAPVIAGIAQNTTMLSHRNLLINGDFSVNQRGVDTTINPAVRNEVFVSDRWIGWQGGNGSTRWRTYNVSNDTTNGNTIILGSRSALHIAPNTTDVGGFSIKQKIESRNIPYIWGKQCTLSFRLFTHQTGLECHMSVRACNTTDDFLNVTNIAVKSFSVPNGPAMDVSFLFTCPEAARNGMVVDIYFTAPSFIIGNGTGITNIQLELGGVATPFEHRPYSYELSLCQRYYASVNLNGWCLPTQAGSSIRRGATAFPVLMRAIPTVSITSVGDPITIHEIKAAGFEYGLDSGTLNTYIRSYTADAEL